MCQTMDRIGVATRQEEYNGMQKREKNTHKLFMILKQHIQICETTNTKNQREQEICEKNAMYKAPLSDPQNKELLIQYKTNKYSLTSQLKTQIYVTTQMNSISINMMHLNHRQYFKISLENKVGIIRIGKKFD